MMETLTTEKLGLYISIPFCRSKCSYCNFASGVYPVSAMGRYVARLIEDLRGAGEWAQEKGAELPAKIDSIYFGGGTPSLLPPALLEVLFAGIRSEFELTADAEITLECAPGQVDDDVLGAMVEAGVNRVSFGVQSFVDREAAITGRLHTRASALADIRRMQQAGVASINVDLIAGLPQQSPQSWCESLRILAATGADHASVYMLEVDEDSRLGRELLGGGGRYHAAAVPSEDVVADLYEMACDFFQQQGLRQYEISNFARQDAAHERGSPEPRVSRHNLKYWQRKPYLGLGVDAHSMLRTTPGRAHSGPRTPSCDVFRLSTTDNLQHFLTPESGAGSFEPEVLRVSPTGQLEEAWFLGLRLNTGVSLEELRAEFGAAAVADCREVLKELRRLGLIEESEEPVRLTRQGRLLSNEVFERFLTAEKTTPSEELISVS